MLQVELLREDELAVVLEERYLVGHRLCVRNLLQADYDRCHSSERVHQEMVGAAALAWIACGGRDVDWEEIGNVAKMASGQKELGVLIEHCH